MELLRELATSQRRAVVVVTHDPRLEPFADRVVRVEDGRIQSIPPAISLRSNTQPLTTAGSPGPESSRSLP